MKPCTQCKYAALCTVHGGPAPLANYLMFNAPTEDTCRATGILKYADGSECEITVNVEVARFYRTRPKGCPGEKKWNECSES